MESKPVKVVVWFINNADYFLKAIVIVFTASAILIHVEKGRQWMSIADATGVLMGDSYTTLNTETFSLSLFATCVLILLRLMGWLFLPLVAGIAINSGYQRISDESWKTLSEIERLKEKQEEVLRQSTKQGFMKLGYPSEEAEQKTEELIQRFEQIIDIPVKEPLSPKVTYRPSHQNDRLR